MQVDTFSMGVELDVFPPEGGDPYKVQYTFPTARMKAPLSIGMEVPVKVMADDPNAVAVQWDALKGSIAASGGDMAVAMQGIQNTYSGTADAAGRAYLADKAEADAEAAAKVAAERPGRAAQEAQPAQGSRPRQRRGVRDQEGGDPRRPLTLRRRDRRRLSDGAWHRSPHAIARPRPRAPGRARSPWSAPSSVGRNVNVSR